MILHGPARVAFFGAEWCRSCGKMDEIIREIKREFRHELTVRKINIDKRGDIADALFITKIPTLVIRAPSGRTHRLTGLQSKDAVIAALTS